LPIPDAAEGVGYSYHQALEDDHEDEDDFFDLAPQASRKPKAQEGSDLLRYLFPGILLQEMRGVCQQDGFVIGEGAFEALAFGIAEREVLHTPDNQRRPVCQYRQLRLDGPPKWEAQEMCGVPPQPRSAIALRAPSRRKAL
jgi:hypothetical protein